MTSIISFVPSVPVLQGTDLNHSDFLAIIFEIPDTSLIIKSNFSLRHGSKRLFLACHLSYVI